MGTSALMGQHYVATNLPPIDPTPVPPVSLNGIEDAVFLSQDELKIGDMVYTITNEFKDVPHSKEFEILVKKVRFSPNGKNLIISCGGSNEPRTSVCLYSVIGEQITFLSEIYKNNAKERFRSEINIIFSPDGTKLLLTGEEESLIRLYSISNNLVTFISEIYKEDGVTKFSNYSGLSNPVFLPDSKKIMLASNEEIDNITVPSVKVYSISESGVAFDHYIYSDNSNTPFNGAVGTLAISPDGTILVITGGFTNRCKLYSISEGIVTYKSYVSSGIVAGSNVSTVVFSPDSSKLVLGGNLADGEVALYTIGKTPTILNASLSSYFKANISNNTTMWGYIRNVVFTSDSKAVIIVWADNATPRVSLHTIEQFDVVFYRTEIYADNNNTPINDLALCADISPDGKVFILGGQFTKFAKIYAISTSYDATFRKNLNQNDSFIKINRAHNRVFSPDNSKIALSNEIDGKLKLYSISGNKLKLISSVYMDNNETPFNDTANVITFSPDGTKLFVSGWFTGFCKMYSISDTEVKFIGNVYTDNSNTLFENEVECLFLPDSTKFILYGYSGSPVAKIYSVNETTTTFLSNIYMDNGTTVFDGYVSYAGFSSDNSVLILCGEFTGFAKRYSVSGATITFLSNIYADGSNTPLSAKSNYVKISNDKTRLILSGDTVATARIYSISTDGIVTFLFDTGLYKVGYVDFTGQNLILYYRTGYGVSEQFLRLYKVTQSELIHIASFDFDLYNLDYNKFPFFLQDRLLRQDSGYLYNYSISVGNQLVLENTSNLNMDANINLDLIGFTMSSTGEYIIVASELCTILLNYSSLGSGTSFKKECYSIANLSQDTSFYEARIGYCLEDIHKASSGTIRLCN